MRFWEFAETKNIKNVIKYIKKLPRCMCGSFFVPCSGSVLFFVIVDASHEIHDLFVAGTNFLNRNIMVDNVDDACHVFAHVCFDVVWLGQQLRQAVVQVSCNNIV